MKMKWNLKSVAALLAASSLVSPAFANEGAVPKGVPRLDHVFVIMMENHGYKKIIGNPNLDTPNSGNVCPIFGSGTAAERPATYFSAGLQCTPGNPNPENKMDE